MGKTIKTYLSTSLLAHAGMAHWACGMFSEFGGVALGACRKKLGGYLKYGQTKAHRSLAFEGEG